MKNNINIEIKKDNENYQSKVYNGDTAIIQDKDKIIVQAHKITFESEDSK